MSVQVKGLQELVDKLESLTDEKVVTQIQKKALKKKANGLLREMQNVTLKILSHSDMMVELDTESVSPIKAVAELIIGNRLKPLVCINSLNSWEA